MVSDKKHGTEIPEITGLKAGIIGLGKSGGMIADAMKFFLQTFHILQK